MEFTGKERPILMKGEMVRAILAGQKTQTRRVIKPQPGDHPDDEGDGYTLLKRCPYGDPGDRLWVRETWRDPNPLVDGSPTYRADYVSVGDSQPGDLKRNYSWKPSIFMWRRLCRIELEIKSIRAERINDISDDDMRAEGAMRMPPYPFVGIRDGTAMRGAFWRYWRSINGSKLEKRQAKAREPVTIVRGADGYGAAENVWCWVIEFAAIKSS